MILGIDTSNYKTSAACLGIGRKIWQSEGRFLDVEHGKLGLRQSEALFQHTKYLPDVIERLKMTEPLEAVAYSDKPREVEGSYMPCFLAGRCTAESIGRFAAQLITYSLQITFWQDHVAIEYQKILTLGALGTIVATLARTRVLLIVIMYIHHVFISFAHLLAGSL